MTVDLDSPAVVMNTLQLIENDLAFRQLELENAAREWFLAKRDKEKQWAELFLIASGTVADRKAHADLGAYEIGREAEAEWTAVNKVVDVLKARASILQTVLNNQGKF